MAEDMDRRRFFKALAGGPIAVVAGSLLITKSTIDGKEFIALEATIIRNPTDPNGKYADQYHRIEVKRAELKNEVERRGASIIGSGVDSDQLEHRITVHGAFDQGYVGG